MLSSREFEVDCGDIQPYRSKHLNIRKEIDVCLQELLVIVADGRQVEMPSDFRRAIAPTAWLDLSIVKLASSSPWSHSDIEIDHTSLQHSHLQSVVHNALSHKTTLLQETPKSDKSKTVDVKDMSAQLQISWSDGSSASLDKQLGVIFSWKDVTGAEMLVHPLDLCLYRAPTDNDKGGDMLSYAAQWKDAGYQGLQRSPNHQVDVDFSRSTDGSVAIVATWVLTPSAATKRHDVGIEIKCTAHYTFSTDGSIDVDISAQVPAYLPPLPRFGIAGALSADYSDVCWFGKGPHEAYDDRKTSAYLGVFHSPVQDLHTPYMRPQENGRRADVAWVVFKNGTGSKIVVLPNGTQAPDAVNAVERYYNTHVEGYGFNASRFSMSQLIEAKHDHELVADASCVYVNFDSRMMGIGGYDSWSPNVDDEFLIKPGGKPLEVKVRLFAIPPQEAK
eukprot:gene40007-48743_t